MVIFYPDVKVCMQLSKVFFFLFLVQFASITIADSGVINFIGQVVEGESCTTTINDEVGDKTIILPTVLTSDFTTTGATPSKVTSVPFKFKVSGCDHSVSARGVYFSLSSNDYDNLNNNLLKNNAVNGATNVGVEILEGGMPVTFNGKANKSNNIIIDAGEGTSDNFLARYKSTDSIVTAGGVITTLNWNLAYN